MFRNRQRAAWLFSLVVHAVAVLLAIPLLVSLRNRTDLQRAVDTHAEADEETIATRIWFDEAPVESAIPIPKQLPVEPPKAEQTQIQAVQAIEKTGPLPSSSNASPEVPKSKVGPLHGKLSQDGFTVVYVLDRSGSMGREGRLSKARELLKATLQQLSGNIRFQIVIYDSSAEALRFGIGSDTVLATPENIQIAAEQLDCLRAEGSSRHLEGLRIGLRYHPNLLVILSDADDFSESEVRRVREWDPHQKTVIHAVILGKPTRSSSRNPLREICQKENGIHYLGE